jgi:hypothetical protein
MGKWWLYNILGEARQVNSAGHVFNTYSFTGTTKLKLQSLTCMNFFREKNTHFQVNLIGNLFICEN